MQSVEIARLGMSRFTKALKFRLIDELKTSFKDHPTFPKLPEHIQNKYAFDERPSEGIVVKNISGDPIQLAADNFVGYMMSHVYLANVKNKPNRTIEWVREDILGMIKKVVNEDVSVQLDGTQRFFQVQNTPLLDPRTGELAEKQFSVRVKVNNIPVLIDYLEPETGYIYLHQAPRISDIVTITYYYRTLVPPGIYYVEAVEKNAFMVDPLYVIDNEVLVESYAGETTLNLLNFPILPNTLDIWRDMRIELQPNVDYIVDNQTGEIILLRPQDITPKTEITANYKYPGVSHGPYTIIDDRSNNQAIKGVVLAFERGMTKGDKQAVVVTKTREQVAQVYGGKWDMSVSIDTYTRDPKTQEELADLVVSVLWERLKPRLDQEGIVVKSVSHDGESEELFDENSGSYYYSAAISLEFETDWELHKPLPFAIRWFDYVLGGQDTSLTEPEAIDTEESSIQMEQVIPQNESVIRWGNHNFEKIS